MKNDGEEPCPLENISCLRQLLRGSHNNRRGYETNAVIGAYKNAGVGMKGKREGVHLR